jgi:hypothetical protein
MSVAVLTVALCFPASARERRGGLWNVMRRDGFLSAMNEDAHIWPIGDMDVGARHYHLVHFEWEESKKNMQGSWPHGRTKLLVFERTKKGLVFLGGYDTGGAERPRIEGHTAIITNKDLDLPGGEVSNTITFDENGPPALYGSEGDFQK